MLGILVLLAFECCGVTQAVSLCKRHAMIVRVWLGMVMGLMEMMWFPSLFAYFYRFTLTAQQLALGTSVLISVLCLIAGGLRKSCKPENGAPSVKFALLLVLPAALLSGYLQYTHTLREIDGAYYVGQSTYGDLCMHLSFATGLVGQSYPPEYTLLPGTTLGYPFLVDALSSTMLIFGTPLSWAFVIPGTLMSSLVFLGMILYAWEISGKKGATILAFLLLLLNGGLGFLQTLNHLGTDASALENALYGYYQTPTNMPEENLRWVNALCDLIVPQRTLMAGWLCVIPALYLLSSAIRTRRTSAFVALGLWAGPMVMIHTHSFLALGVISLGALIDCLIRSRGKRWKTLLNFGLYGVIACSIAYPQLMEWTFPQTLDGGSLRLLFNWVNNNENGRLIDGYFWFWIKNVGLVYLIFPIAALSTRKKRVKAISLGAFLLYALAEAVVFQPNVYDNNKLFYVAFIAMLPAAAETLCEIYARMKGIRGREVLAAAFIIVSTMSGTITIARECVSGMPGTNYQIFSSSQVEAAEFIRENTLDDALFLTANQHNNAVASLTGRKIVCGSSIYLYYHGLDYQTQEHDARRMLASPETNWELFGDYGIDYVFLSSYEESEILQSGEIESRSRTFKKDENENWTEIDEYDQDGFASEIWTDDYAMPAACPLIYKGGEWYETVRVYAVSPRAIAAWNASKQG